MHRVPLAWVVPWLTLAVLAVLPFYLAGREPWRPFTESLADLLERVAP